MILLLNWADTSAGFGTLIKVEVLVGSLADWRK